MCQLEPDEHRKSSGSLTRMRFSSLEIVKLLKPRLGFGSPDLCEEPVELISKPRIQPVAATEITPEDLTVVDDTQLSLIYLADELEAALKTASPQDRTEASESLKELASLFALRDRSIADQDVNEEVVEPPIILSRASKGLEGCKVAAIGFGRQDIPGLATGMIDRRARIEFLPRGDNSQLGEFDLLLLNAASAEVLKREAAGFREVLALGIPTIIIGSRAALTLLRDSGHVKTCDFASKPLHIDELVWRATNLVSRCEDASIGRRLPARVVVADSDPFTRTLIESAMNQLGVECTLTEEGEAAWTAIESSRPGAVILDLTLPNRDGFQLLADIRRAAGRKPKIIVLSARQSEADVLRAFSLGADDYVTKPFSPLELSARLTRLLGGVSERV